MASLEKLLGLAAEHLEPGERVEARVQGHYATKIAGQDSIRAGVMLATDRRLLFYAKKMTGFELESFPYANISSFEQGQGFSTGKYFRFFASGNKVEIKFLKDDGYQEFMELARQRAGQKAVVPAQGPGAADPIELLRRLGELRDAGVVTPEEFEAKKAQLLAQI